MSPGWAWLAASFRDVRWGFRLWGRGSNTRTQGTAQATQAVDIWCERGRSSDVAAAVVGRRARAAVVRCSDSHHATSLTVRKLTGLVGPGWSADCHELSLPTPYTAVNGRRSAICAHDTYIWSTISCSWLLVVCFIFHSFTRLVATDVLVACSCQRTAPTDLPACCVLVLAKTPFENCVRQFAVASSTRPPNPEH